MTGPMQVGFASGPLLLTETYEHYRPIAARVYELPH
jgi:hypothetical protein